MQVIILWLIMFYLEEFITDRIKEIAEKKLRIILLENEIDIDLNDILHMMGEDLPIKRLGTPNEFGPLVAFLCSEKQAT